VLELDSALRSHRTFHLRDPFRIVTDIYSEGAPAAPTPGPVAAGPPREGATFDERPVRRIAIDPGHGGKDPGAVGRGNVREKDVVLRVARELEKLLDAQGFDAFLTRKRDVYLTLEQRTQLANSRKADLFISIHANASPSRKTSGVETYLLDTRYDRQTARVAARENGTTVGELNDLQRILASLRLGYNERFAARLAENVQQSLLRGLRSKHSGTRDLGVKRGPFLVLFMADMPAVLVELGFVTHRAEAKRMQSKGYARAAARGLARGISQYRDEHARSLVATR
jgi:N-acetylmuramoyl-L-alanine amidase